MCLAVKGHRKDIKIAIKLRPRSNAFARAQACNLSPSPLYGLSSHADLCASRMKSLGLALRWVTCISIKLDSWAIFSSGPRRLNRKIRIIGMALPTFNMRQLLEAGVHFGHQAHRWNPKMAHFIFGARNNIHIIDLTQTTPLLHQALVKVSDTVAGGGRVLFVATKRQASETIAAAATKSAQYYINHRWLGGTLTNWKTVSQSIRRLRQYEEILADPQGRTKKETLSIQRERDKLNQSLGGIKDMGGVPNLLFVIDTNKEQIAIKEAKKLGIQIVAIVDTNCDPDGIDFPIPGNDDAGRAITLYCDLIADAVLDGLERSQAASGADLGAQEAPPAEKLPQSDAAGEGEGEGEKEVKFQGIEGPRGEPDDLKKIGGIDEQLMQRLNDAGLFHFWQIVDMPAEQIKVLDAQLSLGGAIVSEDWVEQSKKLVAQSAA